MKYIYLYDGTFNNLLNTIEILLKEKKRPENILSNINYQDNLFNKCVTITNSNTNKYRIGVYRYSKKIYNIIYAVFLSCEKNKELIIYYFLLNAFKHGEKIIYLTNLNCVSKSIKIARYVHHEAHKMKGFIRFQELKNKSFFAIIEPTNNILPLIIHHFEQRLPNENWFIYDKKRDLINIYYNHHSYLVNFHIKNNSLLYSEDEKEYEKLWQTFFKTIGIEKRKNYQCQRNFMPKKYWNNLIEMRDEK